MCGRCFCTLEPELLSKACNYKDSSGKFRQVSWFCKNDQNYYKPSPNVGPRDYLPIISAGNHFGQTDNRILVPMMWGMVPSSWTEDPRKHRASTHNARLETIEHTMYKDPLSQGCRCIVVMEGMYEWKTTGSDKAKQPYFIYMNQKDGVKIENLTTWSHDWDEEKGWQGLNVIKMAGLFKKTKNVQTNEVTYSFTIITRESNEILSWLHHRMPIFLNNPEDEEVWLNHRKFTKQEALTRIQKLSLTDGTITWHPVSTTVNNVKNKQLDIILPVNPSEENGLKEKAKQDKSRQLMASWLMGKKENSDKRKPNNDPDHQNNLLKRPKNE